MMARTVRMPGPWLIHLAVAERFQISASTKAVANTCQDGYRHRVVAIEVAKRIG